MCLINVAHELLTTQTGKKSKLALVNVMGPGAEGPRGRGPTYGAEGRGPRKTNTLYTKKKETLTTWCLILHL